MLPPWPPQLEDKICDGNIFKKDFEKCFHHRFCPEVEIAMEAAFFKLTNFCNALVTGTLMAGN
jgi:hypothetical protein